MSKHDFNRKRCTETTRKGDQCRNPAKPGSDYCTIHDLPSQNPPPRPQTKW